jgi:hypothetical protein
MVKIYIIVTYNGTAMLAAPIIGYIVPRMLLFSCTAATSHPRKDVLLQEGQFASKKHPRCQTTKENEAKKKNSLIH